jgi:hypothetical protein
MVFMFCSRNNVGCAHVNVMPAATTSTHQEADPAARHLAMLQRLADFGMRLAERAAEEALAEPAQHTETAAKSRRRGPDPRYVFLRLSRFVRDIIVLEARLAAGKRPPAPRNTSRGSADPRAPAIRNFMNEIIEASPLAPSIKAGFHNQLNDLIAQCIAADPDRHHPAASIVASICEELGLACDTANLADHRPAPPDHFVAEMASIAAATQAVQAALAARRARVEAVII